MQKKKKNHQNPLVQNFILFFLLKVSKIWPSVFSSSKNTFSTWNFTWVFLFLWKPNLLKTSASVSTCNWSFQSERNLGLFFLQLRKRKNRPWVVLWSVPVVSQLAHLLSSAVHVEEQGKFGWKSKREEIGIVWHVRGALLNSVSMKDFHRRQDSKVQWSDFSSLILTIFCFSVSSKSLWSN